MKDDRVKCRPVGSDEKYDGVLDVRDRVMSGEDVLVDGDVVTTESNEWSCLLWGYDERRTDRGVA